MTKFGRNYILTVELQDGQTLTIGPPFTLEFDITRHTLNSANIASFRIYNLSKNHRSLIRKDVTALWDFRTVRLKAGYGNTLPVVFNGNITQAWSVREGNNFITQIESFDGGEAYVTGDTNVTYPKGTPFQSIITALANSLPGVSVGAIGSYPGVTNRASSYVGPTMSILSELTGGGCFIDNGKIFCLGNNECQIGSTLVINSQSGLLGTPMRQQTILSFDLVFEPGLVAGQKILLDSREGDVTGANFNGIYKIVTLHHHGMISAAVCGDAITNIEMFYGTEALSEVPGL